MNLDKITNMSRTELLRSLGLAPRWTDYLLPAVGLFVAGTVVGAGTALLLAPRSGAKLRHQLREDVRSKLGELERLIDGEQSDKPERAQTKQVRGEHRETQKAAA